MEIETLFPVADNTEHEQKLRGDKKFTATQLRKETTTRQSGLDAADLLQPVTIIDEHTAPASILDFRYLISDT